MADVNAPGVWSARNQIDRCAWVVARKVKPNGAEIDAVAAICTQRGLAAGMFGGLHAATCLWKKVVAGCAKGNAPFSTT